MRKIILTPYKTSTGEDYKVRESLFNLLYSAHLRLNARALLENDRIAHRIGDNTADSVLLEDADYDRLKASVETFDGYGREDTTLVRRILDAETVQVEEVNK